MAQTSPPTPDDTTKVIGIAYILANVLWFLFSNASKLKDKFGKRKTDEYKSIASTLSRAYETQAAEGKDQEAIIHELEETLVIRGARIDTLEREKTEQEMVNRDLRTALAIRDNQVKELELEREVKKALELENDTLKLKLASLQGSAPTKPISSPLSTE